MSDYRIGQGVQVHSFGRWRTGTVTKIGRTRVTVDYQANKQGGRRTKAFPAEDIRPAPACAACGEPTAWTEDAWVCSDDDCGSEWYPSHGDEYAEPSRS